MRLETSPTKLGDAVRNHTYQYNRKIFKGRLRKIGFGCYVCVMDSYKNDQTTCINVVNCKIVTETCQLFFCMRCVWVVFRHRYLRRCGFGLSRFAVQVASETRSYKHKRFPYPSFRAISCKRVCASEASIALMYLYYTTSMI